MEKMMEKIKKFFSNGPKAIFVVLMLVLATSIVLVGTKNTITVVVDGKEKKITTFASTYKDALKKENINVGPKDKTSIGLDSKIEKNSTLFIKRAVDIDVDINGESKKISTAENDIKSLFAAEGIKFGKDDIVTPSVDSSIAEGMKIELLKVESKLVKETKPIEFATVVKSDNNLEHGKTKTVQNGKKGEKEVAVRIVYKGGKEVSRQVLSEKVTAKPVEKVVAQGTQKTYAFSRGGNFAYDRVVKVKSTAYCPIFTKQELATGAYKTAYTYTGAVAKRNPNGYSSIAVDPRVIPLGSKVYVEGYGLAIAEDIGSAVKGNWIDVYFHTLQEASNWGVKYVNVYILK